MIIEDDSKKCPKCGKLLIERQGKHGRFLGCIGYPKCKYILDLEKNNKDLLCPNCNKRLIVKNGRYGKFISCLGFPKCKFSYNLSSKKKSNINYCFKIKQ